MATDITIEKVWRHKKSTCVAIVNHSLGTRCGYCSVSMAHPFYRKSYTDDSISELEHKVDEVINVHGGVTYSGDLDWAFALDRTVPRNQWWFGFDCCHAGDTPDPELILDPMIKKMTEERNERFKEFKDDLGILKSTMKDLEFVQSNCNDMAEHLSKFVYNSVDFILGEETDLHAVSNVI